MRRLRQAFTRTLRSWAARRHGADSLPHTLSRRRIYILPTRFGLMLGALLVAMLIAGLNYGSNLALAFAFLMASLAIVAMHHCHRNLLGLSLHAARAFDGFAAQSGILEFGLVNPSAFDRYDLEIHCGECMPGISMIARDSRAAVQCEYQGLRRGVHVIPQWELCTRYPFGWFRAWTYVQAPLTLFVAPAPRGERPEPATDGAGEGTGHRGRAGEEDFAGLRGYRPGDALKNMAWKVLARGQEAAVRHYSDPEAVGEWIDFAALPGLEPEMRLQQLCRWILDREARGIAYGLRLPAGRIEPSLGATHRRDCLRALAAFP